MRQTLLIGITVLAFSGTAVAQLNDLYIRGFVSQGYLNTSHNNYLVEQSKNGSTEYNEAAISLQAFPEERLRVGIQLFARDFGDVGNNYVVVDWAYADYQWRDYLGVRFGKFKTTQGLYGQGRDIDMLRPTVLLPQAVYIEDHRDFILGAEGLGIYGNLPMGDVGGFDYEIYGGTLNVPDSESGFWHDIFAQAGEETARESRNEEGLPYSDIEFLGLSEPKVRFDWVYGGSLRWNCPVSGFTFGVSALTARFDMSARMQYSALIDDELERPIFIDSRMDYAGDIGRAMVLSAQWSGDKVTLISELSQEKVNDALSEGYYVQGTFRTSPKLTLTSYYSRFVRNKNDDGGALMIAQGFPDFVAWQNDVCVALRYDYLEHLILKFEYHSIDGMGLLSPVMNDLDDDDAYQRWWSFMAAKATVHF